MFLNYDTKELSCKVQTQAATIRKCLYPVFENAISNAATELKFLQNLTNDFPTAFGKIPFMTCRVSKIHGKPIVKGPDNKPMCELGDLLVVVKYHLPGGIIETKSIIYQVKLSRGESTTYDISAKQCLLLSQWPQFSFGRGTDGKPQVFNLLPKTLEFGSYMLEPREGFRRIGRWRGYGIAPTAIRVYETTNGKSGLPPK